MIGIIAAMDIEVEAIAACMQIQKEETIAGCHFISGTIGNQSVVLGKSGVGKSQAAMATTILCMHYPIKRIINVGTAGGLLEKEEVLDIVISDQVVQADFDTSPIDGPEGIGLVYPIKKQQVEACVAAAKACQIPYHVGMIASQDIFMSDTADYQRLMARFPQAVCSEMEAGALGQVAQAFGVDYVVVRSLSDVVCHSNNPMEFSVYAQKASQQTARLICALLN